MTTTKPRPVPPGVAFQAAGPIVRDGEATYVSPRDLPSTVAAHYNEEQRTLDLRMGFRAPIVEGDTSGELFECQAADGTRRMELAFARDLRRVAWVRAFDVDLNERCAQELQAMIDSFQEAVLSMTGRPLAVTAAATLRLVREMTPSVVRDLSESRE